MANDTLSKFLLTEIDAETPATRKCLERIPLDRLNDWKPHETSMAMGGLARTISDMPAWMTAILMGNELDLAEWKMDKMDTTEDLIKHFDNGVGALRAELENYTDDQLQETFILKMQGKELTHNARLVDIESLINHWVHHRGQLTVYMRMNEIAVPSIYGPSGDENVWG